MKDNILQTLVIWAPVFILFLALLYLLFACSHIPDDFEENEYVESVMWHPRGNCPVFMTYCQWEDTIYLY